MSIHLRRRPRLHLLLALVVSSFLFFSSIYPSLHVPTRIYEAWHGTQRRIVVFGDSFSDTATYAGSPPEDAFKPIRDPAQGQRWTEVLCAATVCDSLENYARTYPYPEGSQQFGALVDNRVYANASLNSNSTMMADELLPDLADQVQQWMKNEQKRPYRDQDEESEPIFVVFFGTWDVWQYAKLSHDDSQAAIAQSMQSLFHQLDKIATHARSRATFVVPSLWDLTFTPRFRSGLTRQELAAFSTEEGYKLVRLVRLWNMQLLMHAQKWDGGELYVPDTEEWFVGKIRHYQLFTLGIKDSTGASVGLPDFADVSRPCLEVSTISTAALDKAGVDETMVVRVCDKPEEYMFW